MDVLLSIVGLVFAILQIILFFKLWGMTDNISKMANDVRDIKLMYLGDKQRSNSTDAEDLSDPGDLKEPSNEQKDDETPTALYILAIFGVILLIGIIISFFTK